MARRSRAYLTVKADATGGGQRRPLVVVGSLNADSVLEIDRLPKGGETMNAKTLNTFPGGKVRYTYIALTVVLAGLTP